TRNRVLGGGTNSAYGLYFYNAYQSPEVTNNILANNYAYGMYLGYLKGVNTNTDRGKVINNVITLDPSKTATAAMYINYPDYIDILNNTCINNGQSGYGAYLYLNTSAA